MYSRLVQSKVLPNKLLYIGFALIVQFTPKYTSRSIEYSITGADLPKPYTLKQFHFHFGFNDRQGKLQC